MYYYILFTIIIVCLLIIFVIFKKNSGKTDKLAVTEAIKEKQAQIKKRLFESKLEKKILNLDRKSTRLNSSHIPLSRMPSSA